MFKKILIFLVLLFVGSGAIAYYYWQQVTAVPDWFQEQAANVPVTKAISNPKTTENKENNRAIATKIKTEIQQQIKEAQNNSIGNSSQPVEVNLSYSDFNQLVTAEVNQKLQAKMGKAQPSNSVPTVQTQINANSLKIGTIINPQQLESANLSPSQRALVSKVTASFPQLQDQEFYLGIEGKTNLESGKINLTKDSQIKVGNLRFTVAEIAQRLAIPPEKVQQALQLNLDKFAIADLQLEEEKVRFKVTPNQ